MVVLFFDSVEAKDQISDLMDEISQKAEDNIRQQVHKNFCIIMVADSVHLPIKMLVAF